MKLFGFGKKDTRVPVFWDFADKQGEKVKHFQQRLFVIFDNSDLEYFKGVKATTDPSEIPAYQKGDSRGKFNLSNCTFSLETNNVKGYDYIVSILFNSREYLISVKSLEDQKKWQNALISAKCVYNQSQTQQNTFKKVSWGFAEKMGEKVKNWNDRYLVLYESATLEYYDGVKNTDTMECEDITKAKLKGSIKVKDLKFKCPPNVKDHLHVISLEFPDRDFLLSFTSDVQLQIFKTGFVRVGALFYDPYTAPEGPSKRELRREYQQLTGRKISNAPPLLQTPLIWDTFSKLGEQSNFQLNKWTERYFVLYSNAELEYYKGVRINGTDLPDLSLGELKGKIKLVGSRFKISQDNELIMTIKLYGRDLELLFKDKEQIAAWRDKLLGLKIPQFDANLQIVKFGMLDKQGEMVKHWQKRYFVLWSNSLLEYYKGVKETSPNELADFKKGEAKGKIQIYGCQFNIATNHGKDYCICINTPERDFRISFYDKEEMCTWQKAFLEVGCETKQEIVEEECVWIGYGLAEKLGENIKNWTTRYFVIQPYGDLDYYKLDRMPKDLTKPADVSKAELKGSAKLDGTQFQILKDSHGKENVIQIELKNGRNLVISFKDQDKVMKWKKYLIEGGSEFFYYV